MSEAFGDGDRSLQLDGSIGGTPQVEERAAEGVEGRSLVLWPVVSLGMGKRLPSGLSGRSGPAEGERDVRSGGCEATGHEPAMEALGGLCLLPQPRPGLLRGGGVAGSQVRQQQVDPSLHLRIRERHPPGDLDRSSLSARAASMSNTSRSALAHMFMARAVKRGTSSISLPRATTSSKTTRASSWRPMPVSASPRSAPPTRMPSTLCVSMPISYPRRAQSTPRP
jgi:hypothetical protein